MGWRRVSEAVYQKTPIVFANKTFKTTSNKRNEAMFKEATEFAQSIKVIEKDMKGLLKNIDGHFKNLRNILVSPLPRIFDEGPMGVHPLDEEQRLLGADMEVEAIPRAAEVARKRIYEEVLEPLHDWLNIYQQIQERMRVLEALRLELDSRRRTVGNLQGKLERVRSTVGKNRDEQERETIDTMDRKREKMENTGQRFMEMEQLVYNSLFTLVRDTAVLRDYTHCCLSIIQEAFQSAAKAYDTLPVTQQSTTAAVPGVYGAPPENKYEAQLTGTDRGTPKGIGGLFDRLRGKSGGKPYPASPGSMKDAQDTHDQVPYGYPPYQGAQGPRATSGYPPSQGSMRPTGEPGEPAAGGGGGGLLTMPSATQPVYGGVQYGAPPPSYGPGAGRYHAPPAAAPPAAYGALPSQRSGVAPGALPAGGYAVDGYGAARPYSGAAPIAAGGGWTKDGY